MKKKNQTSRNPQKDKYLGSSMGKGSTYKDLKRQAVSLGMPFPDVVSSSIFGLSSYIDKSKETPDPTLVDKFDEWMSKQLDELGYSKDSCLRHPRLRLGFISEEVDPETGEVKQKSKRVPGLKKPKKPKREKDSFGHVKGTKKQYTWELTEKGLSLERITRRVLKKFPDANTKSIQLWYRAAKRQLSKDEK